MATVFLILIIIFGITTIITFIIGFCVKDAREKCASLTYIFFMATLIAAFWWVCAVIPEQQKEFPSAKYELKYKVTEFGGVSDTTYVLIPKKNESK